MEGLKGDVMKYAGLLLMPMGFFLVAAALVLFADPARRGAFVCCGLVVEAIGLGLAVRANMPMRGTDQS